MVTSSIVSRNVRGGGADSGRPVWGSTSRCGGLPALVPTPWVALLPPGPSPATLAAWLSHLGVLAALLVAAASRLRRVAPA